MKHLLVFNVVGILSKRRRFNTLNYMASTNFETIVDTLTED